MWLPILLLTMVGAAMASEPLDETKRWVPSFALFFDALGQKGEGSVTSGPVLGPPLGGPNGDYDAEQDAVVDGEGCLRRSESEMGPVFTRTGSLCGSARPDPAKIMADSASDDTSVAPLVGVSLELMTPSPLDGFLHPRLFIHGDAAASFGFERNLAGVESPDAFSIPQGIRIPNNATPESVDIEELSILGQGSRTRTQVRPLVLSAGGGIALSLDVFGRRIRIKPSIEYLRQELDLIGVVQRAVQLREPSGARDLSGFRLLSLTRIEKETYHGIGPGLEVEIDAARLGPFVSSVYMMGRGYHLFGNLDTSFSTTNQYGESASWTFEPQSWVWRGGVGFRLRWLPESD